MNMRVLCIVVALVAVLILGPARASAWTKDSNSSVDTAMLSSIVTQLLAPDATIGDTDTTAVGVGDVPVGIDGSLATYDASTSSSSSSSHTFIVDNTPLNGDCPNANYTTIQAAVTASGPGDTVKVCPGTYPEQVRITGHGHDKLKLESLKPLQAIIKWPTAESPPLALVDFNMADHVSLRGFTIAGPFTFPACSADRHEGVLVENAFDEQIDHNHITMIANSVAALRGCQEGDAVAIGHRIGTCGGHRAGLRRPEGQPDRRVPEERRADLQSRFVRRGRPQRDRRPGRDRPASRGLERGGRPLRGGCGDRAQPDQRQPLHRLVRPGHERRRDRRRRPSGLERGRPQQHRQQRLRDRDRLPEQARDRAQRRAPERDGRDHPLRRRRFRAAARPPASSSGATRSRTTAATGSCCSMPTRTCSSRTTSKTTAPGRPDTTDGIRLDANSGGNQIRDNHLDGNVTHDCHDDSTGTGTAFTANFWTGNHGNTENRPGLCTGH